MKDLAAEFRSEVTIQFGLVTDITLMDVGLEPLRGFITSFRQRFPAPIAQPEYRVQPQRQVCSLCPVSKITQETQISIFRLCENYKMIQRLSQV